MFRLYQPKQPVLKHVLRPLLLFALALALMTSAVQLARAQNQLYIVRQGDSLYGIAIQFGVTVDEIAFVNGITNVSRIEVGQQLTIPGGSGSGGTGGSGNVYTVRQGDTLYSIARQFGVTVDAIQTANGITNISAISVGQQIQIPGNGSSTGGTQAPAPQTSAYTVQAGDTLYSIAQRFDTSTQQLILLNNLENPSALSVGQQIAVPGSGGGNAGGDGTYTVQPGDTLFEIGRRFGTDVLVLQQLNDLTNIDAITVGQVLRVPGSGDADGDGVPDFRDRCPNQGGSATPPPAEGEAPPPADGEQPAPETGTAPASSGQVDEDGCPTDGTAPTPEPASDVDNDGVDDESDLCPNLFSTGGGTDGSGCPNGPSNDSDGDGQVDSQDQCPVLAATEGGPDGSGCPNGPNNDTDADGVLDNIDQCPNESGAAIGFDGRPGCPAENLDRDGDGVNNDVDACPDSFAEGGGPNGDGCPEQTEVVDTDGDGVADGADACPTEFAEGGGPNGDGCPAPAPQTDKDNDGTVDANDQCPYLHAANGGLNGTGCPNGPENDTDEDGASDSTDRCPNIAAAAGGIDGCPNGPDGDEDGDGWRDDVDQCPNDAGVVGPVGKPGCPAQG